jgi:hypothetical protein
MQGRNSILTPVLAAILTAMLAAIEFAILAWQSFPEPFFGEMLPNGRISAYRRLDVSKT